MKTIVRFAVLGVFALGLMFTAAKIGSAHAQTGGAALVVVPDGGSVYVATVGQKFNGSIQCREPACARVIPATGAPSTVTTSCATDLQVEGVIATGSGGNTWGPGRGARTHIESGGFSRVVAGALDGGDPGCVVFTEVKNP